VRVDCPGVAVTTMIHGVCVGGTGVVVIIQGVGVAWLAQPVSNTRMSKRNDDVFNRFSARSGYLIIA